MFYDTVSSNDANKSVTNYLLTKRLSKSLGLLIAGTVVSAEGIDVLFSLLFSQYSIPLEPIEHCFSSTFNISTM